MRVTALTERRLMGLRQDIPALIRTSFPGRDPLIERVFHDNQTFRDLCQDYRRCAAALNRWSARADAEAVPRQQEYAELLAELGREIESWLDAMETDSPRERSQ